MLLFLLLLLNTFLVQYIESTLFVGLAIDMTIELDVQATSTTLVIESSISNVWYAVGFGNSIMTDTYTVVVSGSDVTEHVLPNHSKPKWSLENKWNVHSIQDSSSIVTIIMSRDNDVNDNDYYKFDPNQQTIELIVGHGTNGKPHLSYHGGFRQSLQLSAIPQTTSTSSSSTAGASTASTESDTDISIVQTQNDGSDDIEPSTTATASIDDILSTQFDEASTTPIVTSDKYERFELVLDQTYLDTEETVMIMIGSDITNRQLLVAMVGPPDAWFGIGFGGDSMDRTYSMIVHDTDISMMERTLGDHSAGVTLFPSSTVVDYLDGSSSRLVFVIRDWSSDGNSLDFSDFLNCQTSSMDVIYSVGYGYNFGYHKRQGNGIEITQIDEYCQLLGVGDSNENDNGNSTTLDYVETTQDTNKDKKESANGFSVRFCMMFALVVSVWVIC